MELFAGDGFLALKKNSTGIAMAKAEAKPKLADKCPECGSTNLIHDYDSGETVCSNCGLVLHEQTLDKGPEWRAFTQEEKQSRSRVGVPTSYSVHDKGLSTAIGRVDRDAFWTQITLVNSTADVAFAQVADSFSCAFVS